MRFSSAGKSTWTWHYVVERCRFQREFSLVRPRLFFRSIDDHRSKRCHVPARHAKNRCRRRCPNAHTCTRYFLSNRTRLTAKIAGEKYGRSNFEGQYFTLKSPFFDWFCVLNVCFCRFFAVYLCFSINP